MNPFLQGGLIVIAFFFITLFTNLLKLRISLFLVIGTTLYFIYALMIGVARNDNVSAYSIYFLLCCLYILLGSKDVPFKTQTAVFSRLRARPTGVLLKSGINWIDPIFEIATVNVDGIPNIAVDLQELKIEIPETPKMQTKTRGIQAKIKHVLIMLKLTGNIQELFAIEGGAKTIRETIKNYILEFFLDEIGKTLPVDLDVDKGDKIRELAEGLKIKINSFCVRNGYPYKAVREITIGDTELEEAYYEALAKKAYAVLTGDADDITATRLKQRLLNMARSFPGNEKEKMEYALNSLKIVPRSTVENKVSVDATIATALTDIARILKGK